ncbi:sarcosine oxidase subunit gamma [Aureimonas sp. SK2]|uniref:sarcosine oxidase subunit gamma n=1 Tax=Aureimonas sp. SK2 TaxID=3015992 RepID=UPI002443BED3|nr:sarcosine oxidase subunit gamma family protein [Aureimonas sp. SK2]
MDTITERGALHGATLSPLGNRLAVSLAPQCGRIALRAAESDRQRLSEALGFALPAEIGDLHVAGQTLAACLGPDEWQILVPEAEVEAIQSRLEPLRDRCSVVDVSHRELGIEVRGSAATLALSGFCALDLDAMPSGSVTRTILDKATAILVKHGPDHYRIEVWNSFASHVWELLACAHTEIRLDV